MTVERDEFQAADAAPGGAARPRTFLEDLSLDLTHLAALLAHYAEQDANRGEARAGPVTARQVAALIAARKARSAAFGLDLANPGWSLLLELYRARLAGEEARTAALPVAILAAPSTIARWLARLAAAGLAERGPAAPGHPAAAALTDAGAEAMADYFRAVQAGGGAMG
jgi:hypothetical protein